MRIPCSIVSFLPGKRRSLSASAIDPSVLNGRQCKCKRAANLIARWTTWFRQDLLHCWIDAAHAIVMGSSTDSAHRVDFAENVDVGGPIAETIGVVWSRKE